MPARCAPSTRHGFTLVELAIVLAILGLLAGGILAGRSLIRSAEIRGTMTQMQSVLASINNFEDQYRNTPGDLMTATKYWGSAGGTGSVTDAACYNAQTAGSTATCNGNGDRKVFLVEEIFTMWKQLANAGMIDGSYTGKSDGGFGTNTQVPGQNMPRSRMKNANLYFQFLENTPSMMFPESNLDTNGLFFLGKATVNNYGVFTPQEAWQVDTKIDDGNPVYGTVFSMIKNSTVANNCTTSDSAATATYDLAQTSTNCIFYIRY